jgi:hypothetical protein
VVDIDVVSAKAPRMWMGMVGWTVSYGWMDAQKSRTVSKKACVLGGRYIVNKPYSPTTCSNYIQYCPNRTWLDPRYKDIRKKGIPGTTDVGDNTERVQIEIGAHLHIPLSSPRTLECLFAEKSAEDYCSLRKHLPVFGNICDAKLSAGYP